MLPCHPRGPLKNLKRTKNAQIGIAVQVPATAVAGQVVPLGATGLRGLMLTDRATAETLANGKSAPGLHEGEATVELVNVHTTISVPVAAAIAQFAALYVSDDNIYNEDATGTPVGATLGATPGPGTVEVALF